MNRKQQSFFACMMIVLAAVACQVSGDPVSTPTVSPTRPAADLPLFTPPTPTVSAGNKLQPPDQSPTANAENDLHAIFPSFSLTDPNTVCVQHYGQALSCLDATGWHIYKDGPTPRRITHCTDGRIYLVDDEIYQYQVKEETLASIGGWVDQGVVLCGRGSDIWVSDLSEVMRFDGSTWTSYTVEDYFESHDDEWPDSIHSLGVAPNGNAWVTTNNTIAVFNGAAWEVVTPPGNYSFDESSGRSKRLVIDSNGVVWITANAEPCCSDEQLLKFDGLEWSVFPGPDDNFHGIQIVAVDNENRVWAATTGTKIFTLNPDTSEWELRFDVAQLGLENEWESRFEGQQLGLGVGNVNRIHQMEFDGQGRLWVTTSYGLGIYDGVEWTIYHDYTANLYMNDISDLYILGDGSRLPTLKYKPFGSIRGKLVSEAQTPFTDALAKICIKTFTGNLICADQAESVNADGSFVISNVPPGSYFLHFKIANEWYTLVSKDSPSFSPSLSASSLEFGVKEGEETQLGEITTP